MNIKKYTYAPGFRPRHLASLVWLAFLSGIIIGLSIIMLGFDISQSLKIVTFFLLLILLSNLLAKLALSFHEFFA
jgi:hypothetical protein